MVRNFFWWVERRDKGWTEKHMAAYVNIAGTVLGVPKVYFIRALLEAHLLLCPGPVGSWCMQQACDEIWSDKTIWACVFRLAHNALHVAS